MDAVLGHAAGPDHAAVAEVHRLLAAEHAGGGQVAVVLVTPVPALTMLSSMKLYLLIHYMHVSFGMFKIYFKCQKVGSILCYFGWLYGNGTANSTLQSVPTVHTVSTCQSAIYLRVVFPRHKTTQGVTCDCDSQLAAPGGHPHTKTWGPVAGPAPPCITKMITIKIVTTQRTPTPRIADMRPSS